MEQGKRRTISVLLTRYYSTFSNFIYWISGRGYTHASIALGDGNGYYYSFNFKGFRREYPGRRIRKCGKIICYKLEVSQESFERLQKRIDEMEGNKEELRYSRLSLILCLLHIPSKIEKCYFCSQFVAEMLQLSECVSLRKETSLYLPNHLSEELSIQRGLKEVLCNPI